jgi:hypothetical protein
MCHPMETAWMVWGMLGWECNCLCKNALIKKKTKFEIQMGLVAKSYMRKDFLIYGENAQIFGGGR